ncbi:MAG: TylF/MycF/NovP-related O-methyltransferase [Acidobacteriota bacterium]
MIRKVVIQFLRATARGPLVDALPPTGASPAPASTVAGGAAAKTKESPLGKLFRIVGRFVGRFLTPKMKAWIQEVLINTFRITVDFQPAQALETSQAAALDWLQAKDGAERVGDYFEFGVYQGGSVACMHRTLAVRPELSQVRIFGFDSFEGLPDTAEQDGVWLPGQYRSALSFTRSRLDEAGVDWRRTHLVKGFFSDSLTPELVREHGLERAGLIMIDCDLYTSTREALEFCAPLIREHAVIFFDDWLSTDEGHGEQRAFREFLDAHPYFDTEAADGWHDEAKIFYLSRRSDSATD